MKGSKTKLQKTLELNFKEGEKVKVSPVGEVVGFDGRSFIIDPDLLIANIKANALDIPLDANHNFDEALGWFAYESFEARDDGIYASLEFTPKGLEANKNRYYRYLSPVYIMGNGRTVVGLDSVGFVNRPNLLNNALNNKEQSMTIEDLKAEIDKKIKEFEAIKTDLQNELAATKSELKELNTKIAIFAKPGNYQENNQTDGLTDGEKAAARMLGLSEESYKKAKGEF